MTDDLPIVCPFCEHVIDHCRVVTCDKHKTTESEQVEAWWRNVQAQKGVKADRAVDWRTRCLAAEATVVTLTTERDEALRSVLRRGAQVDELERALGQAHRDTDEAAAEVAQWKANYADVSRERDTARTEAATLRAILGAFGLVPEAPVDVLAAAAETLATERAEEMASRSAFFTRAVEAEAEAAALRKTVEAMASTCEAAFTRCRLEDKPCWCGAHRSVADDYRTATAKEPTDAE